jgi:hypothetical protein
MLVSIVFTALTEYGMREALPWVLFFSKLVKLFVKKYGKYPVYPLSILPSWQK